MLRHKFPLILDIPSSFVYYALFHTTPLFLARVLDLIANAKKSILPMIKDREKEMKDALDESHEGDLMAMKAELNSVKSQFVTQTKLNTVAKDVLAVFCRQEMVSFYFTNL